jgi:ribulose-5-phosphate 4-epimerase/fuculose-1-phosphate aldolase
VPREFKVDTPEFAQAIVDLFKLTEPSFKKFGHAVFYPYHGVTVAAPTLDDAFDLLERIEFNASAIVHSKLLERQFE